MNFSFQDFVWKNYDMNRETNAYGCLSLCEENADVTGGRIKISDIDKLRDYPDVDVVKISGLRQDTFEYFIKKYGKQLKAISFWKNKFIEDLSLLGTLPQLEYVCFFHNQRVTALWDMSGNESLTGVSVQDFTRLKSIRGVETAPNLKEFDVGNQMWNTSIIDSFMPFVGTHVEKLSFCGKAIEDDDLSFIEQMPCLKTFDFATNQFTTEQVAWIVANFPLLEGDALKPLVPFTYTIHDSTDKTKEPVDHIVSGLYVVGKRKSIIEDVNNEKRINKCVQAFEALKQKYKGMTYREAFPIK